MRPINGDLSKEVVDKSIFSNKLVLLRSFDATLNLPDWFRLKNNCASSTDTMLLSFENSMSKFV